MSRKPNENTAFASGPLASSCLWNHCAKALFLGALYWPSGCATEPPPVAADSANQSQVSPVSAASARANVATAGAPPPSASISESAAPTNSTEGGSLPEPKVRAQDALAEPISPSTVAKFPHLAPFLGHVLLGGSRLQAVLAGVGPDAGGGSSGDDWQPAIVAFIEFSRGHWHVLSSVGRVEVAARTPTNSPYRTVGVNVGTDKVKGLAYATFVYAGPGADDPRAAVTFRLDGQTGRLALLPEAFGPGAGKVPKNARAAGTLWRLRFRAQGAHDLFAPDVELGKMHGSPYVIRYIGTEIVAAIGMRPFDTDEQLGQLMLTPETGSPGPLVEGWQILVGRDAALSVPMVAATLRKCLYAQKNPANAKELKETKAAPCGVDQSFGTLKLALAAKDAGEAAVSQPIFVYDKSGHAMFYTALNAGEALKIPLPSGGPYRLADTRSGRALKDIAALSVVAQEDLEVTLPPRVLGKIKIDPGENRTPALVTVNRLDQPKGLAVTPPSALLDAPGTRLSPNTFYVNKWPFELPLLAGSYVVELARGGGVFCNVRVSLGAAESRAHFCPQTTFTTAIPALDANISGGDGEQGRAPHYVTADLAGDGDEALQRALGVDVVVPSADVSDPETGLTARLTSDAKTIAALKEKWAGSSAKAKGGQLAAFGKMWREMLKSGSKDGVTGLFELGCPSPGLSLAEYEKTARRLDVDAVRLFGCATGAEQNEHLATAARLQKARKEPVALTSVSARAFAEHGLFFPRLFLPAESDTGSTLPNLSVAALVNQIKNQHYALGAGVLLSVAAAKMVAGEQGTFAVDVETASSPEVSARWIFVFGEGGQRFRQALDEAAPDDTERGKVRVAHLKFKMPTGERFFRIEVRGSSRRSSVSQLFDRNYGTVLATTPFVLLPGRVAH